MFYFAISIFMVISSFIELFIKANRKIFKILSIIICFMFFVFSSIRWEVGTDWDSYYYYFQNVTNSFMRYGESDFEIGYRFINVIINNITKNYTIFIMILASLVFVFQYGTIKAWADLKDSNCVKIYKKSSQYSILILMILWFIYFGNIFVVRSTIAYIIAFYSTKYIIKRNLKIFLILILLASLLHQTTIIYIAAYIVYNVKIFKKIFIIIIPISIFIGCFAKPILLFIAKLAPISIAFRINFYLEIEDYSRSWFGLINYMFLYCAFCILYYYKYKYNNQFIGLLNIFSLGLIIYVMGFSTSIYFIRMSQPFMMVMVLLLPCIFEIIKNIEGRILTYIVLCAYLSMRLLSNISQYFEFFYPFKTIFSILDIYIFVFK